MCLNAVKLGASWWESRKFQRVSGTCDCAATWKTVLGNSTSCQDSTYFTASVTSSNRYWPFTPHFIVRPMKPSTVSRCRVNATRPEVGLFPSVCSCMNAPHVCHLFTVNKPKASSFRFWLLVLPNMFLFVFIRDVTLFTNGSVDHGVLSFYTIYLNVIEHCYLILVSTVCIYSE